MKRLTVTSFKSKHRVSRNLVPFAVALLVAACGGGSSSGDNAPPDPLAGYKNQTINWGSCLKYFSDDNPDTPYLRQLGDRAQCADIRVPLDYNAPDAQEIVVSIMRVKAPQDADSKPNLVFNPGGPGGDGLEESVGFSRLLSLGNTDSTLGRKYKELGAAYNFVGFSPRGVGPSTTIECYGNELVYPIDDTRWRDTAQNIQRINDRARYSASSCQKNPIIDYINTDATARDMDLMRHLLGDEKLHYFGTSYGTWLGFWYAGLFPERVGPMVLDSNVNFTASLPDADITYDTGVIHSFREYVVPYIARRDDVFHMGDNVGDIISDLENVRREVNQAMLSSSAPFRADRDAIEGYVGALKAAVEIEKLYDVNSPDEIEQILTAAPDISDPDFAKAFVEKVRVMIAHLKMRNQTDFYSRPESVYLDNEDAVYRAVQCNDEPLPNKNQEFWINKGFELARQAPVVDNSLSAQACIYWDYRTDIRKPSIDSLKDASLLLVQSQYDVPTPLAGAMETFEQLPAAHMVYVSNEGGHGLFLYQTRCVDLPVADYLLGKAPAQRRIECVGKGLPDDPAAPRDNSDVAVSAAREYPASPFEDPELAEELLERLRKATRR